jgi:metallo-beta-lactamase family protein
MKISPHGAVGGEVTGSAYLIETSQARVLVDFGMFQGLPNADDKNRSPIAKDYAALDAVLLTHAHLDHTGRLPLLVAGGFRGPVFCTPATGEMTNLILRDSAKIQETDLERVNRKRQRQGKEPLTPLYRLGEVEALMARVKPVPYRQPVPVAPGMVAEWVEAGHMLGSASIRVTVEDAGRRTQVVFSGDLGQRNAPILKDYEPFSTADLVVLESTYGNRDHQSFAETVRQFIVILNTAVRERGKILIPTFAVGRAQLLATLLAWMFRQKHVPTFPVFLDSPMANEATNIYARHPELWDEEMRNFVAESSIRGELERAGGRVSITADDSKKLNDEPGPCLIMAGAGMCNAGRILHHLKANLWKPETHVVIVGYQSVGTVGRALVDGAKEINLFGEPVAVKGRVHTLGGFSAHAGQTDLLAWLKPLAAGKPRVILTHGEAGPRAELAKKIQSDFGLKCELPGIADCVAV